MTAITYRLDHIASSKEKAPLYYCPHGQRTPMPALITLDQSGEVYAYHRQGDGTPADEWSGRTLTWRVDPQVSGKWLAEWLKDPETRAALQSIHDKHTAGEDYYDAATEFENQLQSAQEYDAPMVEVWKAFDWIENESLDRLIEAGSIRAWAKEIEDNIPDDVQLEGSIVDAIIEKIEYLIDDEANDEEQEEYFRQLHNLIRYHKHDA